MKFAFKHEDTGRIAVLYDALVHCVSGNNSHYL